ncbi:MoaD/ThiS family protein [Sulfurospirillum barnesii]|uniref:Molybdopterin converting factor, small subunit n=1 Tax=Sulfurospirillum barnesii (strain ATCC 700032 / DSM 10660 / SES-3) TaxID=760154 RepID=I3XYN6_SULBS|nr:MoaD/ThiS family protein [Sulfurospirillum barnesii]AFL69060.1 molybdopterin converting factor, small subunit [Sulfurospirillum barnesii SES-3]
MHVFVKLFAQYREGRFKAEQKEYPEGTTAQTVIDTLDLESVSPLGVLMANGRHVDVSYVLQEGDEIALFPKVGGG